MNMRRLLKTLLLYAALSGMLASCMDNTIEEVNISQTEFIGFTTTTTRASSVDLSVIKDCPTGFRVFATGGNAPIAWYNDGENAIDGANHHRFKDGKWGFHSPVKWSKTGTDYPMKFYAYYPATSVGFQQFNVAFPPDMTLAALYTVQEAGSQEDLMAARITASSRPASGTVGLVFHHLLSKINFGIIAGTGSVPYIQSLDVVNAKNQRGFDFIGGNWFTPPAGLASYRYYGKAPAGGGAIPVFTPTNSDESAFYKGLHSNHLILMPQTSKSWKPQSGAKPNDASGGYICLIYRMNTDDVETPCLVGMDDATKHPDWTTKGAGYTGPLFVKAGFPLPADGAGDFTWEKGYSYLYNIILGTYDSSNGYILDENYYDENGNRTDLPLLEIREEYKLPGDKLNDGNIHFILKVNDWDKDDEDEVGVLPTLRVTPSTLWFDYDASSGKTVSVSTNQPSWTVSSDQSWATVTPSSGVSGQTFNVSMSSINAGNSPRTATITVTAGTLTRIVDVTQGMPAKSLFDLEGVAMGSPVKVTFTDNSSRTTTVNSLSQIAINPTEQNLTVESLSINGGAPILIGRKGNESVQLKFNNGNLVFRDTVNGAIPIGTYAELQLINTIAGALAGSYKQEADINLMNKSWTPIGKTGAARFTGIYDGNGHTLTGLYINSLTLDYAGLFGYVGIANVLSGVFNLGVSGNVTGRQYVGGIVGYLYAGKIENCFSIVDVTGGGTTQNAGNNVGGIAGQIYYGSSLVNSFSTGNVTGVQNVGGIVGLLNSNSNNNSSSVENCYATGAISGVYLVGGVVGQINQSAYVKNCVALNKYVKSSPSATTQYPVGRVYVKTVGSSNSINNHAWEDMGTNGGDPFQLDTQSTIQDVHNGCDGMGIDTATIGSSSFWSTTSGTWTGWDTSIWTFSDGKLPGLFNKTVDIPPHIN